MITRLRSEKGSFVRSPLGAFDSEEGVAPTPFTGVMELVTVDLQAIYVVRDPPDCFVQDQAGFETDRGATLYGVRWDVPRPTLTEQVTYKWVGQNSGAILDPTAVGIVCGGGVYGDNLKTTDQGLRSYTNIVQGSGPTNPTTNYYYNWGFFNLSDEAFIQGEPISLVQ